MKRKQALNVIKYAGYHKDYELAMRTKVENRISLQVYNDKFREGMKAKENGIKCNCYFCNK